MPQFILRMDMNLNILMEGVASFWTCLCSMEKISNNCYVMMNSL